MWSGLKLPKPTNTVYHPNDRHILIFYITVVGLNQTHLYRMKSSSDLCFRWERDLVFSVKRLWTILNQLSTTLMRFQIQTENLKTSSAEDFQYQPGMVAEFWQFSGIQLTQLYWDDTRERVRGKGGREEETESFWAWCPSVSLKALLEMQALLTRQLATLLCSNAHVYAYLTILLKLSPSGSFTTEEIERMNWRSIISLIWETTSKACFECFQGTAWQKKKVSSICTISCLSIFYKC